MIDPPPDRQRINYLVWLVDMLAEIAKDKCQREFAELSRAEPRRRFDVELF
jgi:hypothetical protein